MILSLLSFPFQGGRGGGGTPCLNLKTASSLPAAVVNAATGWYPPAATNHHKCIANCRPTVNRQPKRPGTGIFHQKTARKSVVSFLARLPSRARCCFQAMNAPDIPPPTVKGRATSRSIQRARSGSGCSRTGGSIGADAACRTTAGVCVQLGMSQRVAHGVRIHWVIPEELWLPPAVLELQSAVFTAKDTRRGIGQTEPGATGIQF